MIVALPGLFAYPFLCRAYRTHRTNCDRSTDCAKSIGKPGAFIFYEATCDWLIVKIN